MIENTFRLDMNHVRLGFLREHQLLVLWGNQHSMGLVDGLSLTPDDIRDDHGNLLYPAYFMTYLTVPFRNLLSSYMLWDMVHSTVDIDLFGLNLLESRYTIRRHESSGDTGASMIANSIFVLDSSVAGDERHIAIPAKGCIRYFSKCIRSMPALQEIRQTRLGSLSLGKNAITVPVYTYKLCKVRDISPGHNIMYATFIEIMDYRERLFLCDPNGVRLPKVLADCVDVVERKTYYFGNCCEDEEIDIVMQIMFDEKNQTEKLGRTTPYYYDAYFELYKRSTNQLLVISQVRKVIAVAFEQSDYEMDLRRIVKGGLFNGANYI